MTHPARVVHEDCTLAEAAELMLTHGIGCLPVTDGQGKMIGLVTESDFSAKDKGIPFSMYRHPQLLGQWMPKEHVERVYAHSRTKPVRDIMTHDVVAVTETASVESVIRAMLRTGYHRIPVHRSGVPVGLITRRDLLKLMLEERTSPASSR